MAESSEDEDLKAAIALSMGEIGANTAEAPGDEEVKTAIALSLKSGDATKPKSPGEDIRNTLKSLNEERMARTAANRKRERSISPPRSSRKAPKLETSQPQTTKPETSSKTEHLQYPNGVVKKTWAFGHPRTGHDVKLEEVLEPQTLKTAVLSAYQWDVEWVLAKLKTPLRGGTTKCVFVMQAKEQADREQWRKESEYMSKFLRLCFPAMYNPINCMHSKLMLLFHPNKLRIAIPTANLLNFDWGETGQMENSVFMIDLPRLPEGNTSDAENLTFFGKELMFFLEKQGLDHDVRTGVLNFDFQATEGMAFIHTAGGVHYREEADRTGLLGLSVAINELDLATDDLEIDFAASSIGQLNDKYLRDLHLACKGDMKNLATQAATAKKDFFKPKPKTATQTKSLRETIRIYFPTKETVRASTAGSAGTLCLQRKYFEGGTFPRSCFRDYKSTRPGMLSHNKILCARGKKKTPGGKIEDVAWVYVGSSNVSKSAWGELPADRSVKRITCRNWECGVLLPVSRDKLAKSTAAVKIKPQTPAGEDSETESEFEEEEVPSEELVSMRVFEGIIDLPFETPGALYGDREPFYFTEEPRA